MKKHLVNLLIFIVLSHSVFAQKDAAPWKSLFNGKDFTSWKMVGSKGVAVVSDSTFICHMTANTTEHTFVCTEDKFSDFIMELDVKTDSNYNTGILLRSIDKSVNCDTCKVSLYGYQVKIDPSPVRKWTGGIFDDFGKTWHWLYNLENDERARNAYHIGQWNHFRIEAIGKSIKVWVNNIPVTNLFNSKYANGYVAFKIHALKDLPESEKMLGRYKNVRIITENPERYIQSMDLEQKVAK